MNPSLAIVMPVYQEAENIEKMIRQLEGDVAVPHQLAIIYDREDDNTLPVLKKLIREFPHITLIRNCQGNGRGVINAIKTGFYETKSDYVCLVTADLTDETKAVVPMFQLALRGNDLVSGTRYSKGGKKAGGPWLQTQLSRWGNGLFAKLTGLPLTDPTYSFKMYSRRLLDAVSISSGGGWAFSMELSIKAHLAGFRMAEIGTLWRDREFGESTFQLAGWLPVYLKLFLWGCWKINVMRWAGSRPAMGTEESR